MRKAQTFATIKSNVNAQKLRRRMWSVRGIGTIHLHFTVAGRGCPREKLTPTVNFGEEAFPAWAGSMAAARRTDLPVAWAAPGAATR